MSKVYHARVFYFRFARDIPDTVQRSTPYLPDVSNYLLSAAWGLRYSLADFLEEVPEAYRLHHLKEYLRDLD